MISLKGRLNTFRVRMPIKFSEPKPKACAGKVNTPRTCISKNFRKKIFRSASGLINSAKGGIN